MAKSKPADYTRNQVAKFAKSKGLVLPHGYKVQKAANPPKKKK